MQGVGSVLVSCAGFGLVSVVGDVECLRIGGVFCLCLWLLWLLLVVSVVRDGLDERLGLPDLVPEDFLLV